MLLFAEDAYSGCNCADATEENPCQSKVIEISVGEHRKVTFKWLFHSDGKPAFCGRFANGDYWVSPASNNGAVTIQNAEAFGSGPLSLDENPQLESMGLLKPERSYGNYSASEAVHLKLPRQYRADVSLMAAVRRDEAWHGKCGTRAIVGNCADAYNVLTVLKSVPPGLGKKILRPSVDEDEKRLVSLDDLEILRVPKKRFLRGGTKQQLEMVRQRWSHSTEIFGLKNFSGGQYSEGGRAFRASLLIDDYAAGVAAQWYDDLFMLMARDNPERARLAALSAMLVYGKDIYHAMYDGSKRVRNWGAGAGQSLNRFPPAVFYAALLKGDHEKKVLKKTSLELLGYSDIRGPHELEQVNQGVDGPVWGDFPDSMSATEVGAYWGSMLKSQCFAGAKGKCNPRIGKKTSRDPYGYIDGPPNKPGTGYMQVSLGPKRSLVASMFLIPEMCEIVNYKPLIEYVDRVDRHGLSTKNDPCAPPDPRENPLTCDAYRLKNCEYYGLSNKGEASWGPDPTRPGRCIKNRPGQRGRFPHLHGKRLKPYYSSVQVEKNWDKLRGLSGECEVARVMAPRVIDIKVSTQN